VAFVEALKSKRSEEKVSQYAAQTRALAEISKAFSEARLDYQCTVSDRSI
jgi:hypothetical protein